MQRKSGRAPSGHLSRLKPAEVDPLEEYGLPSKGEKRLLSPERQEAYYSVIMARYLDLCTEAGDRDGLRKKFAELTIAESKNANAKASGSGSGSVGTSTADSGSKPTLTSSTSFSSSLTSRNKKPSPPPAADLSQIFAALRKLREALVASHRHDEFAAQVFLFSIRQGILAASYETYYPALLYLLRVLHHGGSPSSVRPELITRVEHAEAAAYLVLDAACRCGDLATAYALRRAHGLRDAKVDAALRALAGDNWVLWRRVRRSVDGHRARLMDLAEPQLRAHVLKAFGRAYLSVGRDFLEHQSGCTWVELRARHGVGWELDETGERVVIRKVQARPSAA